MMRSLIPFLLIVVWPNPSVHADDWPQWLGPQRDGVWRETGVLTEFPAAGPPVVWRVPVAGGYGGPAVARGRVFLMDYVTAGEKKSDPDARTTLQGTERVWCFDEQSGKELWRHEYPCDYNISYPIGPRAVPTVDGDRVYTLGAEGDLCCLTVDQGRPLWSRKLTTDFQASTPMWGFAAHPLVDGDKLICLVGGKDAGGKDAGVIAFDKMTGQVRWSALKPPAAGIGYSPPTLVEAGGTRQLLIWEAEALHGLNPETGDLYWSEKLEPNYGMSIIPPTKIGDYLFVGAIKDKSMLLRFASDRPAVELVWLGKNGRGLGPSHSPVIAASNDTEHMYGIDRDGELRCIQLSTGDALWSTYALVASKRRSSSATAFLVRQGDRYFIWSETGELVIAKLSPAAYVEISRSQPLLKPTHDAFGRPVVWSPPAFANQHLFVRNDDELIRVDLRLKN